MSEPMYRTTTYVLYLRKMNKSIYYKQDRRKNPINF